MLEIFLFAVFSYGRFKFVFKLGFGIILNEVQRGIGLGFTVVTSLIVRC